MLAIKAIEIYIAGAVPKALMQNEATEIPVIAPTLPVKPKQINEAPAANAATRPPKAIVLDLVNFMASGQTMTMPKAVGTAPTVLITEETEKPPVKASEKNDISLFFIMPPN